MQAYENEGQTGRRASINEDENENEKENESKEDKKTNEKETDDNTKSDANTESNENDNKNGNGFVAVEFDNIGNAIDPLADVPNNPWQTYFQDWEVWNRIEKDINRTHQTFAFFRSNHMIHKKSVSKKYRFPFDTSGFDSVLQSGANSPRGNTPEIIEMSEETLSHTFESSPHSNEKDETNDNGNDKETKVIANNDETDNKETETQESSEIESNQDTTNSNENKNSNNGDLQDSANNSNDNETNTKTETDTKNTEVETPTPSDANTNTKEQTDTKTECKDEESNETKDLESPEKDENNNNTNNTNNGTTDTNNNNNNNDTDNNNSNNNNSSNNDSKTSNNTNDGDGGGYKVNGRRMSYNKDDIANEFTIQELDDEDEDDGIENETEPIEPITIPNDITLDFSPAVASVSSVVDSKSSKQTPQLRINLTDVDSNNTTNVTILNSSTNNSSEAIESSNNISKRASSARNASSNSMLETQQRKIEKYIMDGKDLGIHAQIMIRILCVYARLNKGVEYVQGMNELLAPIYYVFAIDDSDNAIYAEADAFFCFMNLMSYLADRFIPEADHTQFGILACVNEYDNLLQRVDNELWEHFRGQDLDSRFYAFRWLMLLMAMEFELPEVLRLWDSFLSDENRFEFVTYFAVAMVEHKRDELLKGSFASNLQLLQKYPLYDLYELLYPACDLRDAYDIIKDEGGKDGMIKASARARNERSGSSHKKGGGHRRVGSRSRFGLGRRSSSKDRNRSSSRGGNKKSKHGNSNSSTFWSSSKNNSNHGGDANGSNSNSTGVDLINKRPVSANNVWSRVQRSWSNLRLFESNSAVNSGAEN